MSHKNWAVRFATLNLPSKIKMPGTVGSIIACSYIVGIKYYWLILNYFQVTKISFNSYGILVPLIATLIAFPIIHRALEFFNERDPGLICLDELVGMLVTLCLLPINFVTGLLGLVLFRYFDIVKPLGIKKIEQLPGVWGVLLDDVVAGIYANLILRGIVFLITWPC